VQDGRIWAEVRGERWQVRSDTALRPGQRVRVEALHDLMLQVRPEAVAPSPSPNPVHGGTHDV